MVLLRREFQDVQPEIHIAHEQQIAMRNDAPDVHGRSIRRSAKPGPESDLARGGELRDVDDSYTVAISGGINSVATHLWIVNGPPAFGDDALASCVCRRWLFLLTHSHAVGHALLFRRSYTECYTMLDDFPDLAYYLAI